MEPHPPPVLRRPDRLDWVALGLIVAWGLWRLAPGLGHGAIWTWDESFHQVVTRHVRDNPFLPLLYDDPVHPLQNLRSWFAFNVWLHKPIGPFWFGAAMMWLTGVSPLALRLGSLFGELICGMTIYLLGRPLAGRLPAFLSAVAFLSLRMGWVLTQGRFVGDVTDLSLAGCISIAVLCLFYSIERDSWRWAAAAGAATGAGYLCKTVLALTPVGMALVMLGLGAVGFCKGPRLKSVVALVGASIVVAAPWNIYAAVKWPALYWRVFQNTLGFISETSGEDVGSGIRPLDAVFNEIIPNNYRPMGVTLMLVVGGWLVVRSMRRREYVTVGLALWLWATWLGHSVPAVKGHAHLWNSLVAGFAGVALVLSDVWRSRPLALSVVAGISTPWVIEAMPALGKLRELLPTKLVQTRTMPGVAEGLALVAVALFLSFAIGRWKRVAAWVPAPALGLVAAGGLCWLMLWKSTSEQTLEMKASADQLATVYSREVGRALDARVPPKSLLLLDVDLDPPNQFEYFNLMFWSDRLTHRSRDPQDYPQAGYHPYLVSPAAEPFAPVSGVPADSWLRAYDMESPVPTPPELPAGVQRLDLSVANLHVLGLASGETDSTHDHYAFFVHPDGVPSELRVVFETADGPVEKTIQPEATLRIRYRLANAPWYVTPVTGPPRREVKSITLGPAPGQRIRLEPLGS